MENYILYFCAYLIEAVTLWQYCTTLFQPKHTALIRITTLFTLYGILSMIFTLNLPIINIVLFLIANFIIIYFMFHTGQFAALFHASLTTAIMGLSELTVANVVPNMIYDLYDSPNYKQTFIIHMVFSKLIYFLLLFSLSHVLTHRKESKQPNRKEILLILSIPLLSIWILVSLNMLCFKMILPVSLSRMILISCVLLLVINIITWVIYTYTQRKNLEFTTLQLQLQKETDTTEYYKMLLQQNENQQILIHDIKKHLNSLSLLNEQGQPEKIAAYIQQLVNSSDLQSIARMCDNELLNAILSRYARQCMESKIAFHADVRSGVVDFMGENDLTSLFCNLLDNSLEAAKTYPGGYIELGVANRPQTTMTIIILVNSCRVNPFDKYGKLTSKKADTLRHGFGIRSIERIVKHYHGEMQQYFNEEDYTFHTIIMLRNPQK